MHHNNNYFMAIMQVCLMTPALKMEDFTEAKFYCPPAFSPAIAEGI